MNQTTVAPQPTDTLQATFVTDPITGAIQLPTELADPILIALAEVRSGNFVERCCDGPVFVTPFPSICGNWDGFSLALPGGIRNPHTLVAMRMPHRQHPLVLELRWAPMASGKNELRVMSRSEARLLEAIRAAVHSICCQPAKHCTQKTTGTFLSGLKGAALTQGPCTHKH